MVNYKYLETYMTEFKEDSIDCEETVGNNMISAFTMPETHGDNILSFVRKFELHNYITHWNLMCIRVPHSEFSMVGLDLKLERDFESQSVSGYTKYWDCGSLTTIESNYQ